MKTTKIALIGCGRIAGHHAKSIAEIPAVELSAVCDLVEEKANNYSKQYSVPHFSNYHKMLRELPEIDVVAIITPSGMHYEHALDVMENYGKHLIVEKPTFLKPSQVQEVFERSRKKNLGVFPVFQNRHNLAVQRVRKGLQNGELGKIRAVSVRVRWCRPQSYYNLAPWRGTFSQDGGAITNQGIHHIDLLRYFGGEVKRVCSKMVTLGAQIEVEDTCVATVEFESGAVGAIEITTAARPKDYEASLSIVCENGLAQLGGIAVNELQTYTPDPSACSLHSENFGEIVYGNGHKELYREIAAYFDEQKPFSVSPDDCLNTIRLLNGFYKSDELGTWVDISSKPESSRLGRPNEELANLYRTQESL